MVYQLGRPKIPLPQYGGLKQMPKTKARNHINSFTNWCNLCLGIDLEKLDKEEIFTVLAVFAQSLIHEAQDWYYAECYPLPNLDEVDWKNVWPDIKNKFLAKFSELGETDIDKQLAFNSITWNPVTEDIDQFKYRFYEMVEEATPSKAAQKAQMLKVLGAIHKGMAMECYDKEVEEMWEIIKKYVKFGSISCKKETTSQVLVSTDAQSQWLARLTERQNKLPKKQVRFQEKLLSFRDEHEREQYESRDEESDESSEEDTDDEDYRSDEHRSSYRDYRDRDRDYRDRDYRDRDYRDHDRDYRDDYRYRDYRDEERCRDDYRSRDEDRFRDRSRSRETRSNSWEENDDYPDSSQRCLHCGKLGHDYTDCEDLVHSMKAREQGRKRIEREKLLKV